MVNPKRRIRVLVADDSALMRRTLRRLIESDPELELVDTARDGEDVIAKARELRPDVVSMDINMPKLDGISALQVLMHEEICPVVMLSSLTSSGALITFEALELGAFDYVAKPNGTVSADLSTVGNELCAKLKAAASSGTLRRIHQHRRSGRDRIPTKAVAFAEPSVFSQESIKAIAIGISTGGPSTIAEVLPRIPANCRATVFLVQHMPGTFTSAFARRLDGECQLKVLEAEAGMQVQPGHCYVARGDYHLTIHKNMSGATVIRTPTKPDTLFKPSVDVMMESVLAVYGRKTIGVLMTGIGDDGADQMVRIKQAGGHTIAESEESAVVFGMPREAIERGGATQVLPSWEVADAILQRL